MIAQDKEEDFKELFNHTIHHQSEINKHDNLKLRLYLSVLKKSTPSMWYLLISIFTLCMSCFIIIYIHSDNNFDKPIFLLIYSILGVVFTIFIAVILHISIIKKLPPSLVRLESKFNKIIEKILKK